MNIDRDKILSVDDIGSFNDKKPKIPNELLNRKSKEKVSTDENNDAVLCLNKINLPVEYIDSKTLERINSDNKIHREIYDEPDAQTNKDKTIKTPNNSMSNKTLEYQIDMLYELVIENVETKIENKDYISPKVMRFYENAINEKWRIGNGR